MRASRVISKRGLIYRMSGVVLRSLYSGNALFRSADLEVHLDVEILDPRMSIKCRQVVPVGFKAEGYAGDRRRDRHACSMWASVEPHIEP